MAHKEQKKISAIHQVVVFLHGTFGIYELII